MGGIVLSTTNAISDPTTGQVVVGISSGTVSSPVRVLANTCTTNTTPCTGTMLSTQSDQLTITTGIPDQQNVSLSATTLNIEGWDYDGISTAITARLADHFNNPVPDGTAVNFTAEGGVVTPSCITTAGACSATFTSQALRPNDGRVTVLAYAVGEEGFTDLNGNGLADNAGEMIDANGVSTDMGEVYVDYNENGVRDANEPFIDFNGDGVFNGTTTGVAPFNYVGATSSGDGQYSGVLCAPGTAICSAQRSIHVRKSIVIVFSGSTPVITTNVTTLPTYSAGNLDLAGCGGPQTILVNIVDLHGNLMPAGTTVTFNANLNGTVVSTGGDFPVGNANTPIAALPAYNYSVTVKGDGAVDKTGVCADTTVNGNLTVTVATPKGNTTKYTIANLIH